MTPARLVASSLVLLIGLASPGGVRDAAAQPDAFPEQPPESLLKVPTEYRFTVNTQHVEALVAAGQFAEAATALRRTVAELPNVLVGSGDGVRSMRSWARSMLARNDRLRAAVQGTATNSLRQIVDGPLTDAAIGRADLWATAATDDLAARAAAARILMRMRDAGQLTHAAALARRWQMTALAAQPPRQRLVWPLAAPDRPRRLTWQTPLRDDFGNTNQARDDLDEFRLFGIRPRLTRAPVLHGDALYVRRVDSLLCLDAETLETRWETPTNPSRKYPLTADEALVRLTTESAFGSPSIDAALVGEAAIYRDVVRLVVPSTRLDPRDGDGYASDRVTELACYDADDGTLVWRYQPQGQIVLSNGITFRGRTWVAVATTRGLDLVGLDASGREASRIVVSRPRQSEQGYPFARQRVAMVAGLGRLFLAANEGGVASINPTEGAIEWITPVASIDAARRAELGKPPIVIPRPACSLPTLLLAGDRLVASGPDWGSVAILDAIDGRVMTRRPSHDLIDLIAGPPGEAIFVRSRSVERYPQGFVTELPEAAFEGSSCDGSRLAIPLAQSILTLDLPTRRADRAGPLVAVKTERDVPRIDLRSTTIQGDSLYVQTVDGVERRPTAPLLGSSSGRRTLTAVADSVSEYASLLCLYRYDGDRLFRGGSSVMRRLAAASDATGPRTQIGEDIADWPPGRPVVREQRQRRSMRSLRALPIFADRSAEPAGLNVHVSSFSRSLIVRAKGLPEETFLMPRESLPGRGIRSLGKVVHRGRFAVVQLGAELVCLEFIPPSPEEPAWFARPAWRDRRDRLVSIETLPASGFIDANASVQPGRFGGVEHVATFGLPIDNVQVFDDCIVLRQAATVLAAELATGATRWRRFDIAADERLLRIHDDDTAVALASETSVRVLSLTDGSILGTQPASLAASVERQIDRSDLVLIRDGEKRLVTPRAVAVATPRWSRPIADGALIAASESDFGTFEPATGTLALFGRDGERWATVETPPMPDATTLIVAGKPEGVLVGVGTEPEFGNRSELVQRLGPLLHPSLKGDVLFIDRKLGQPSWTIEDADLAIPVTQPADLPIVVLDYLAYRDERSRSQLAVVSVRGTRPGSDDPIKTIYPVNKSSQYDLKVDADDSSFTLKVFGKDYEFDYAAGR